MSKKTGRTEKHEKGITNEEKTKKVRNIEVDLKLKTRNMEVDLKLKPSYEETLLFCRFFWG